MTETRDPELVRRLERCEMAAWGDWFRAASNSSRLACGIQIEEAVGATAVVAANIDVLALNRVTGLGLERPATAADIDEAYQTVGGGASPVPLLASLARRLEKKAPQAGGLLDGAIAALDRALGALEEAEQALATAAAAAAFDANELERVEERLFALRAAARKHAVAVADLPALARRMAADLAALEHKLVDLLLKQDALYKAWRLSGHHGPKVRS